QRAFTIIFFASIVIWFAQSFDLGFNFITDQQTSILATIAGFIAPVFRPLGFGDWRVSTALITGFIAKESVVATLNVLVGTGAAVTALISPAAAICLLVFCLLYTPCVAAIAAIKRELGAGWAAAVVVFQCVLAYAMALIASLLISLF
ncbi:MAG: ferrous iron transporter B, partial [Firmicutes bacterium]|nr:ferrous iron transporter B [Bacillota bacterium]